MPFLDDLKNVLSSTLPRYSIPSDFRLVSEFPRNPSGKLSSFDLKKAPYVSASVRQLETNEQWDNVPGELQLKITNGLCEVFNGKLLPTDLQNDVDLGSLGIDSLGWMQFSYIMERDGFPVEIREVIKAKKLSDLASLITATDSSQPQNDVEQSVQLADRDCHLADELEVSRKHREGATDHSEIGCLLVTGATGFLGPYLVRSLLNQTSATIVLLVRKRDGDTEPRAIVPDLTFFFRFLFQEMPTFWIG